MPKTEPHRPRPPSATNGWVTLTGALSGILAMLIVTGRGDVPVEAAMLICGFAIALPILVGEVLFLKTYKRESTGLGPLRPGRFATGRIFTKLVGLWGTYAIIAFFYWLLPEYNRNFFNPFYRLVLQVLPWVIVFSIPYFALVDQRMRRPHDAYWHLGRILLGHWVITSETKRKLKEHALGWTIKAFFLPLMTVFFFKNIGWMMAHPPGEALASYRTAIFWFISLGFFLDVAFAFIGYALTLRVLDTHIRSSNPLLLGWGVALVCYPPFWTLLSQNYMAYQKAPDWFAWIGNEPTLAIIWGSVLIALVMAYSWATVIFGLRFSNLTHRGIITGGPYRYTKHPAYVSKNLFWWLSAVPFVSAGGWEVAFKACILLFMVNGIYFLRARTEEKHLSSDPAYVAYAEWINDHGMFSRLSRIMPFLRFRAPKGVSESGIAETGPSDRDSRKPYPA